MSRERLPRIGSRAHPLDNAIDVGERVKNALVRSKIVVEKQTEKDESSPSEYAERSIQDAAEDTSLAAKRFAVNQGKKLVHRGKEALHEQRETQRPIENNTQDVPTQQAHEEPVKPTYQRAEQPFAQAARPTVSKTDDKTTSLTIQRERAKGEQTSPLSLQKQTLVYKQASHSKITANGTHEQEAPNQHGRQQIKEVENDCAVSEFGKRQHYSYEQRSLTFAPRGNHERPSEHGQNTLRHDSLYAAADRQQAHFAEPLFGSTDVEDGKKYAKKTIHRSLSVTKQTDISSTARPHQDRETSFRTDSSTKVESGKAYAQKTIQRDIAVAKQANVSRDAMPFRSNIKPLQLSAEEKHRNKPLNPNRNAADFVKNGGRTTGHISGSPTIRKKVDMKMPQAPLRSAVKVQENVQAVSQTAKTASNAAQKAVIAAHRAEKVAVKASKEIVKAIARAVGAGAKAAWAATRELIATIAAGGWVTLVAVIVLCLIGAFIASPFGILFSNEPSPGAMPLNVAVGQLNMELSNTLEELQEGDYDSIDIQGEGPDWREVIAVFASKTAGSHDGVDVAVLTPDRVDRLKAVFWDMCIITSEVEEIEHPGEGEDDEGWTEYILHIAITAKTAEEMRTEYTFTNYQNEALTELLAELEPMELLLTDLSVSQEQARDLLANLPDDLAPERRAIVENACQLVGKVSYYWGGKSLVLGWDSRWGTIQKVWAEGNSTTGTYRLYGLDCSGFVDWAFYNATGGSYVIGHGGGATMQHNYCTTISWADAIPGDLVFYPEDSHVGIVGGRDADGNLLIVHCASSYNGVVITTVNGFTSIGRPVFYAN